MYQISIVNQEYYSMSYLNIDCSSEYIHSSVTCKQLSAIYLQKSPTTKYLDTVADESRKKMAYSVNVPGSYFSL